MLTLAAVVIIAGEKNGRAQGQNVPNLSGAWELIEHDGTTKRQLGSKFPSLTLAISQTASEIKIAQKTIRRGVEEVQEFAYHTDGRVDENTGRITTRKYDFPKVASVTEWEKDKLVIRYHGRLSVMAGNPLKSTSTDAKEEWRLSSGGKKLVLTSHSTQMDSAPIGGAQATSNDILRAETQSRDLAPRAQFFTSKLVFRKVS